MKAEETLGHVVSLAEVQANLRPEPYVNWISTQTVSLTIQTKRVYISAVPSSFEEMRTKYAVMLKK